MKGLPEVKRACQAEIHFALGAVIQGITVAALGGEIATALKALPGGDAQFTGNGRRLYPAGISAGSAPFKI